MDGNFWMTDFQSSIKSVARAQAAHEQAIHCHQPAMAIHGLPMSSLQERIYIQMVQWWSFQICVSLLKGQKSAILGQTMHPMATQRDIQTSNLLFTKKTHPQKRVAAAASDVPVLCWTTKARRPNLTVKMPKIQQPALATERSTGSSKSSRLPLPSNPQVSSVLDGFRSEQTAASPFLEDPSFGAIYRPSEARVGEFLEVAIQPCGRIRNALRREKGNEMCILESVQ